MLALVHNAVCLASIVRADYRQCSTYKKSNVDVSRSQWQTPNCCDVQELRAAMGGGAGGGAPGLNMPMEELVALEQQLRQAQERVERQGGVVDEETLRAMHPLEALLRTLLPWVNAGEEPEHGSQDEADGA